MFIVRFPTSWSGSKLSVWWMLLSDRTSHGFWPVSQNKQHELKSYCLYIYTVTQTNQALPLSTPYIPKSRSHLSLIRTFYQKIYQKKCPFQACLTILPLKLLKAPQTCTKPIYKWKNILKIPSMDTVGWFMVIYPLSMPQSQPRIMKNWKISSWITRNLNFEPHTRLFCEWSKGS